MFIPPSKDEAERGRGMKIPDEAAHFVALRPLWGPVPEGHEIERWRTARKTEGGRQMRYQAGDELPFEAGRELASQQSGVIVVLDEDGDVLAGAGAVSVVERGHALSDWRSGDRLQPASKQV